MKKLTTKDTIKNEKKAKRIQKKLETAQRENNYIEALRYADQLKNTTN